MEQQRNLLEMQNEELRKAHADLEVSHQRFSELHEQAPVGYLTFDTHGCIREINTAATNLLGVTRAYVLGKPFVVYVEKADRKKFLDHLLKVRRAASTVTTDLRLAARKGAVVQAQMTTGRHQDAEGRSSLFLSAIEDVTALRLASVNTAYLASIVESSQDGIISYSPDGFILSWNPGAQKLLGYSPAEIIGRHATVIVPDERLVEFEGTLLAVKSGATVAPYDTLRRHKDGSSVAMELTVSPIMDGGRVIAFTAIWRDISGRKRAEEQLRRNHKTFYDLIKDNPFGIYVIDADFVLREVSLGAQKVFSNVRPLLGRDFAEVLRIVWPEPFASEAINLFRHTLETGEPFVSPSTVERRHDIGEIESYDWRIERINMPDGRFGAVCYFYDLSERQRWEAALRESEERFRAMVTASSDVVYRMSPDYREMRPLDGRGIVASTETGSRTWLHEYIHPEDQPQVMAAINEALRIRSMFAMEHRVRRVDGTWGWMLSRAVPMLDANGEIVEWFGASADVTERKEAEEVIRKLNEELEARVAARTAALLISTESLMRSTADVAKANEERRHLQDEVLRTSEAERARIGEDLHDDLGQQLAGIWCLSLAMQKNLETQSSPEAAAAARISEHLGKSLALTRSLARGLHPVAAEAGGLVAALRELADRSSELFTVRCRLVCRDPVDIHDPAMATHLYRIAQEAVTNACKHGHAKHIHIALSTTPKRLKLSVSDDGRSIPKPDDAGNGGMGIRIMNFRAESLGGSLVFHWKPGGGSRVSCTIPFSTRRAKRKH